MTALPQPEPNPDNQKKTVVCVLTQEQYDEYEEEFSGIKERGAEITLIESADMALTIISEIQPHMVFVGMELEEMEGFEFLAMFTSQNPDFENPVVVLPEKADGLPPVVHSRAKDTGHSAVNGVDFEYITSLLYSSQSDSTEADSQEEKSTTHLQPVPSQDSLGSGEESVSSEEDFAKPSTDSAPEPQTIDNALDEPVDTAGVPDPFLEEDGSDVLRKAKKKRYRIYLALGSTIPLLLLVAYFVLAGTGGKSGNKTETTEGSSTAMQPSEEVVDNNKGSLPAEPGESEDNSAPAETMELTMDELEEVETAPEEFQSNNVQLPSELILPLVFDLGSHEARVVDEEKLSKIVQALSVDQSSKIVLTGHASVHGKSVINYKLGLQRAEAAKRILVERNISEDRIKTASLGSHVPLTAVEGDEEQQQNRRVTVTIQRNP